MDTVREGWGRLDKLQNPEIPKFRSTQLLLSLLVLRVAYNNLYTWTLDELNVSWRSLLHPRNLIRLRKWYQRMTIVLLRPRVIVRSCRTNLGRFRNEMQLTDWPLSEKKNTFRIVPDTHIRDVTKQTVRLESALNLKPGKFNLPRVDFSVVQIFL